MSEPFDAHGCPVFNSDYMPAEKPTIVDRVQDELMDVFGPPILWNTEQKVKEAMVELRPGEVDAAAARVEKAAQEGSRPGEQAFQQLLSEEWQFGARRGGHTTIMADNAFDISVMNKLRADNPSLVDAMSLAWAAQPEGTASSRKASEDCLNWDRQGVSKAALDRYIMMEHAPGGPEYYLAQNFQKQWDSLSPVGGSVLNHVDLGQSPMIAQSTIEQRLAAIDAQLTRAQAHQ